MTRPSILQINQTGAWRTALEFDAKDMPPEFHHHLDQVLRLTCKGKNSARVVMAKPGENGRAVATHMVLQRWSVQEGWVNT